MATKSTVAHSEEIGEAGVGKMRAVMVVKWQDGGHGYQREAKARGLKAQGIPLCFERILVLKNGPRALWPILQPFSWVAICLFFIPQSSGAASND